MIIVWRPPSSGGAVVAPDYPAESDVKIDVEYSYGELVGTLEEIILTTRQGFNKILKFVGSTSLTDEEYEGLTIDENSTAIEIYEGLDALLTTRESVSSVHDRLEYYFLAKGVEVTPPESASSQIYVGGVL